MKLRVFHYHDGKHEFMVAAANQKEAAERLRISVYGLRKYGQGGRPADREIALSEPGRVWKRKIRSGPAPEPWLYDGV